MMTLKFIFKDERKTIEYALLDHYFNKYAQLMDSLFRKWVTPQFTLSTIHFDLHLIDRYTDDYFYNAVHGHANIRRFGIVLMQNEIQRQTLKESNYSADEFTLLKRQYDASSLTSDTWLMRDQNDRHLIIADEKNVLKYLKQVVNNLSQLRTAIIDNNDYEIASV